MNWFCCCWKSPSELRQQHSTMKGPLNQLVGAMGWFGIGCKSTVSTSRRVWLNPKGLCCHSIVIVVELCLHFDKAHPFIIIHNLEVCSDFKRQIMQWVDEIMLQFHSPTKMPELRNRLNTLRMHMLIVGYSTTLRWQMEVGAYKWSLTKSFWETSPVLRLNNPRVWDHYGI